MSEHEARQMALDQAVKLASYVGESEVLTIVGAAEEFFNFLVGKESSATAEA